MFNDRIQINVFILVRKRRMRAKWKYTESFIITEFVVNNYKHNKIEIPSDIFAATTQTINTCYIYCYNTIFVTCETVFLSLAHCIACSYPSRINSVTLRCVQIKRKKKPFFAGYFFFYCLIRQFLMMWNLIFPHCYL